MKAKVVEIFQSIQGEGKYSGIKQVFVRFFGCNMHCVWCDTPDSLGVPSEKIKEYTLDEMFVEIDKYWENCHSVSLTGGEPLLQKNAIGELLPLFKKNNMPVYLETNGIFYQELEDIIRHIDIIAMDIKLPSSTGCQSYWEEHKKFLKIASKKDVFIKAVISNKTTLEDIMQAVELTAAINPDVQFIIQPNYFDLERGVMEKCVEYRDACQKRLKDVRIMPQAHKMMGIR